MSLPVAYTSYRSTWEMAKRDPKQIWLDLCQPGPKQEQAIKLCQKFFEIYSTRRKRRQQICLGPEEYQVVQTVNSADTIDTAWHALIGAEHIPCKADVRIAFHAILILSGIGGFRPGVFNRIRYSEVDLELVLDPSSGEKKARRTLHFASKPAENQYN